MSQSAALRRLLDVLRQRDIPLGRDDVGWAFESAKTKDDIVAWVEQNLNNSTLLSKDELQLYQSLASHVEDEDGVVDHGIRPIRDDELRAAIHALKQSTTAIERQSKSLEAQKRALSELKAQRERQDECASLGDPQDDSQLRARESSQLRFAIEDLQQSNHEQLQQLQDQSGRAVDGLLSTAAEGLERHDQVLDALARLAPKLHPCQEHTGYSADAIDQWCHTLASIREQTVKAHIETVRLSSPENSVSPLTNGHHYSTSETDTEELTAELQSLQDEILSVAKMVIAHDHRDPILCSLQKSTGAATQKQNDWLEYVLLTQEHLIAHLQFFYEQCLQLQGYSFAVDEIAKHFKSAIGAELSEKAATARNVKSPASPTRPDSSSRLKSPTTLHTTSGIEQALLRFNIGTHAKRGTPGLAESAVMARTKLLSQYNSAIQADIQFLAQASAARDRELQSVLSKLYCSSDYGTVRLTDKVLDDRLQEFDESIAETAKDYARVDSARKHDPSSALLNRLDKWRT